MQPEQVVFRLVVAVTAVAVAVAAMLQAQADYGNRIGPAGAALVFPRLLLFCGSPCVEKAAHSDPHWLCLRRITLSQKQTDRRRYDCWTGDISIALGAASTRVIID